MARSCDAAVRVVRALVTGVVVVVGFATLVGLLDRVFWIFEAADVFRLQYLVVLVAAGLLAFMVRRPRLAACAVVLAGVNFVVLGVPLTPTVTAASGRPTSPALRLVVANVEVGNTDFAAVERLVAQTHPDLFGVTELTPAMARHLGNALHGYRTRLLATRNDAYGIGVYSRVPLMSIEVVRYPTDGPPTVVARVRIAGTPTTVVVTHVHTPFAGSIHVRHLNALSAAARSDLGRRVVICGDFNTPPWSGPLRHFAAEGHVRDLYGGRAWTGYSWPTWSYVLRLPLDNCFVSNGVTVTDHHDGPEVGSDHRPLVVDVAVLK